MKKYKREKLEQIYNKIPDVNCKGLCVDACTAVGMSKGEWRRLTLSSGKRPQIKNDGSCIYLLNGKCSEYDKRPLVCRLFGAAPDLPCKFGCKPNKPFPQELADRLLLEVDRLVGDGNMYISDLP